MQKLFTANERLIDIPNGGIVWHEAKEKLFGSFWENAAFWGCMYVQYISTEAENRNDLSASFSIDQSPDQSNPERPTGKVALTHLGLASAHCSLLIITTSVMGMMR